MPRAKGGSIPPPRVVIEPNHGGIISDLNENDVLCGRGGRINNHPGNISFRVIVEEYKREYLDPRTRKLEKAHVAARLVAQIRSAVPPGRFLKDDPNNVGMYFEIGDAKARKKAGQALREDAPDVRKEIGEELEANEKEMKEKQEHNDHQNKLFPSPPHPPSSSYNHLHTQQQQVQQPQPALPHGIPPSVSYSPTSGPGPAAAGGGGGVHAPLSGPRPDPPEAPGVTGYRQPPLRYFESGRGGSGGGPFSGRGGRGLPPQQQHHHQYNTHPLQQGYPHPPNYYGSTPPHHYNQQQQQFSQYGQQQPQYQNQPPPPSYYQQHQPPPPPQFQQQQQQQQQQHAYSPHQQPQSYPSPDGHISHSHQQPPQNHQQQQPQHAGENSNNGTYPQFSAPQEKKYSRPKSTKSASPVRRAMVGISINPPVPSAQMSTDLGYSQTMKSYTTNQSSSIQSHSQDFPLTMSVGKDFTDSDISAFGRRTSDNSDASGKISRDSFTMSDLLGSNRSLELSLGSLGRTRSFPDLTLSSNDLLPPLPADEYDFTSLAQYEGKEKLRTSSRGRIMRPFHRHSSSESSNQSMTSLTIKGFHPVRSRSNTAVSGINDAMSIMSLDSRKSVKSDASSWLDNFRSFQSIHSDMNPWETAPAGDSLVRPSGDEGSLSDVSYDMTALDLAEPLLPPLSMYDSYEFMKPDP